MGQTGCIERPDYCWRSCSARAPRPYSPRPALWLRRRRPRRYRSASSSKPTLQPGLPRKLPTFPFDRLRISDRSTSFSRWPTSRASQAGAPPLPLDAGLSEAARIHALAMLEARQLSHQFAGEPSLPARLAATTDLQLDQEGENVALDYDAAARTRTSHAFTPASREPAQPGLQRDRAGRGSQRRPPLHRAGFRPRPPQLFSHRSERPHRAPP